jgi:hypothetical protein
MILVKTNYHSLRVGHHTSHTIPLAGLRGGTVIREHGEWCVIVVPLKKHSLCHPTGGLDIKRKKYRSIPCMDRMEISTQPHIAASAPEPCRSQMWKM